MEIRNAKIKDLEKIAEIFRVETSKKPYSQKWTKKTAINKINDFFKLKKTYVLEINNEIIGFIVCEECTSKKNIYIDELWIKEDNQGKGLGTKVMKYIENKYRNKGFKTIYLATDKKSKAFKFYTKIKFVPHKNLIFLEKKL